MNNTITELKNSIEGFNGRLHEVEETMSKLTQGSLIHPVRRAKEKTAGVVCTAAEYFHPAAVADLRYGTGF